MSAEAGQQFKEASIKTASSLKSVAESMISANLSSLSLPEVDEIVGQVAQAVPAGNVPGVILNGLARLPGRTLPPKDAKRDVNLLFKGVSQALDKTTYYTMFAGPALVIWGYQNLLKLAGKDPNESFPEGTWQFYADYALREDTARHVIETHGFDTDLKRYAVTLDTVDRLTAWVMAAIHSLHNYEALLENEWRERVYTYLLIQSHPDLYQTWLKQLPYRREADAGDNETYPAYRRRKFDAFLQKATADLSTADRKAWQDHIEAAEEEALPAYKQQMSILAYLDPDANGETRVAIPIEKANVAFIYQGRYYLIPVCAPRSKTPADINEVRGQIATILAHPSNTKAASLVALAQMRRASWPTIRKKLSKPALEELDNLRFTPIILNADANTADKPLAQLRQTERGIGHHALTLFDTAETMVMGYSHIFFDGGWGTTFAEIITNEALSWGVYLGALPPAQARQARPYALSFKLQPADDALIKKEPSVIPEVSAETDAVNVKAIQRLRRLFKRRNDLIQLTVNDLLVLYRAIHAASYRPDPELVAKLQSLGKDPATRAVAAQAVDIINTSVKTNPALVIPVDASLRNPRDRLYPMTYEAPIRDLKLLAVHQKTLEALDGYNHGSGDRAQYYADFDKYQRTYLATLASFGLVLSRAKDIAVAGESASVGTIKLMAHMPPPLQKMLEQVPNRLDMLNDLTRGQEVFSNVGAMSSNSTLTRFLTAKDDNDKKTLAWGVLTDAKGVMRITLRDFRPHVKALIDADLTDVAQWIVQDYLDSYASGLNTYVKDLQRITETSRETQLVKLEKENHDDT